MTYLELDIHEASPDELAAAHGNVFDIWSKGLPFAEHIAARLASPKHKLATWYVGTIESKVAVSLGAYPLKFNYRDQLIPGFSIGSVYTVKQMRGRGYAPQLLAWVEDRERQRGARFGLLYSDIDPNYYARLGYKLCPSLEGWLDPRRVASPQTLPYQLIEFDAQQRWPELARLYTRYHGAMPISIARDDAYWKALLERFPEERFYALVDRAGGLQGYVRIGIRGVQWRITDYALADQSLELAEAFYAAAIDLAKHGGAEQVGGWLPDHPSSRQCFELHNRRTEVTMLKSLDAALPLDAEMLELASRFCEIDHV
jgi:predicted acetyltransferase